jgi:phosphatidylglycerophosphate synthase
MSGQSANSIKQETVSCGKAGLKLGRSIPNAVTLLRLVALPHLIWSFNHEVTVAVYALFLFAVGSDFADGFISRKMGVDSKFGATLDAAVDFIFVNGMYLTFILKGIYSPWLLFLVIFMFAQFILTNFCFKKTIYDPVGKYYASLLFGGIGLTLLFPQQITYDIVTVGIAVSTVSVIISRLAYFLKTKA